MKFKSSHGFAIAFILAVASVWMVSKMPAMTREALVRANEKSAVDILRGVRNIQRDWRLNDIDGNALPDSWAADWSGFHRVLAPGGAPCAVLDAQVAGADADPLPASSLPRPALGPPLPKAPYKGYWFRAVKSLAADGPDADDRAWETRKEWAFAAWPAEAGVSGKRSFFITGDGTIWAKETGQEPEWPGAAGLEAAGWMKVP